MIQSVSMCTIYMLKFTSVKITDECFQLSFRLINRFTNARLAFIIFRNVSSNVQNSNYKPLSASGSQNAKWKIMS